MRGEKFCTKVTLNIPNVQFIIEEEEVVKEDVEEQRKFYWGTILRAILKYYYLCAFNTFHLISLLPSANYYQLRQSVFFIRKTPFG